MFSNKREASSSQNVVFTVVNVRISTSKPSSDEEVTDGKLRPGFPFYDSIVSLLILRGHFQPIWFVSDCPSLMVTLSLLSPLFGPSLTKEVELKVILLRTSGIFAIC